LAAVRRTARFCEPPPNFVPIFQMVDLFVQSLHVMTMGVLRFPSEQFI